MPELPEVETVRRALAPLFVGRRLVQVEIRDPRLVAPDEPVVVARELEGERVAAVGRRGKYLIVRFASGRALVSHLRMTGSFLRASNGGADERAPHTRAVIVLDDGSSVVYRDVRRFGTWRVLEADEADPYLDIRLGVEPLDAEFTAAWLADRLAGRRAPLKAALLDQRTVAGLGNIYADEALWLARLNPLLRAGELDSAQLRRLPRAIRAAFRRGLALEGATLRDYRRPDGELGRMQQEFHAYGRDGSECDRCGAVIEKTRVAGRGTWYCPRCQRART